MESAQKKYVGAFQARAIRRLETICSKTAKDAIIRLSFLICVFKTELRLVVVCDKVFIIKQHPMDGCS
jgi:hypothetical protein